MHPGRACVACHDTTTSAPRFTVAGTVFPTAHEPDDCDGASGMSVIITDAAGKTVHLTTNAAGNFFTTTSLAKPYQVKVVSGTKTRSMGDSVESGDCNGCHTKAGENGAPGRIRTP
jgi:hypothetical protein